MTNLYFVRHAHSVYTADELNRPLSDKGFADAKSVTERLKKENIDIVISSPYRRAIQTVAGIAAFTRKEILIDSNFRERALSDGPLEDFESAVTKAWTDFHFSLQGGESSFKAQHRGVSATNKVLREHQGKNIVIGTHGNIMVLIMNYFDPTYDFAFWKKLEMPDVYKLTFSSSKFLEAKRV